MIGVVSTGNLGIRINSFAIQCNCGNTVKTANVTKDSGNTFTFTFTTQNKEEVVMVWIVVDGKEEEYVSFNIVDGIVSTPNEYDEWKEILQ